MNAAVWTRTTPIRMSASGDTEMPPPAPAIAPTTVRTTIPSTSSITAAPRITRASGSEIAPMSRSTRAVTPTDVATSTVAVNTETSALSCTIAMKENPRPNGTAIPAIATRTARGPVWVRSESRVSRPTWNSRMTTPSSATVWITRSNACPAACASLPNASVNAALGTPIQPSICGPSITPARISPMTAGCLMRSHTSAKTLAATNMTSRSSRIHPTGFIGRCLSTAPIHPRLRRA